MTKVFISHATEDRDFIDREIVGLLRDRGIEVWYAQDAIRGADHWEKSIKEGLNSSEWFLVVLSANSVQSEWVQIEVSWAVEHRGGKIVPVVIGECDPDQCHLKLRLLQHIDFSERIDAAQRKLLAIWDSDTADEVQAPSGPPRRRTSASEMWGTSRPGPEEVRPSHDHWLYAIKPHLVLSLVVLAGLGAFLWGLANLAEPTALLGRVISLAAAAGPLVGGIMAYGIPAVLRKRRAHKLAIKGMRATFEKPGYFRIDPYTANERDDFDRADKAHLQIVEWLRESRSPFLYLTGLSGTGKSSLLHAYLLPEFSSDDAPFVSFVLPRARAFHRFQYRLLEPGVIWDRPPADEVEDEIQLLQRACRHIAPKRLLLIVDQFEEYLMKRERSAREDRETPFERFMDRLREHPLDQLVVLFVVRSDFKGLLDQFRADYSLPRMNDGETWKELAPFTERAARKFLAESPIQLDDEALDEVFGQLAVLEDQPGLVRPVALNMVGLVLDRTAIATSRKLPPARSAEGFLAEYVRSCLTRSDMRDVGRAVARRLVTFGGQPQIVTVGEVAASTRQSETTVVGCLLTLAEQGLAREVDSQERLWGPSHDFVARLLGRVLVTWPLRLLTMVRNALTPLAFVAWAIVFLAVPSIPGDTAGNEWYAAITQQQITAHAEQELYLHKAIRNSTDRLKAVQYFVQRGIDVDLKDSQGRTAAWMCIGLGADDCLAFLLEHGANVEAPDATDATLLQWAAFAGQVNAAELLIRHGANLESRDQTKVTPLLQAAISKRSGVLGVLLEHGANADAVDLSGRTAGSTCAMNGDMKGLELLLQHVDRRCTRHPGQHLARLGRGGSPSRNDRVAVAAQCRSERGRQNGVHPADPSGHGRRYRDWQGTAG